MWNLRARALLVMEYCVFPLFMFVASVCKRVPTQHVVGLGRVFLSHQQHVRSVFRPKGPRCVHVHKRLPTNGEHPLRPCVRSLFVPSDQIL